MKEYGYEIWLDGQCLIDSENCDEHFDSEEEANEVACDAVRDRLDEWKSDGCWDGETFEDFDIRIIER